MKVLIQMTDAAEEKEKGATKIQIYHTNKGAVIRPGKETMDQTGLLFPKTPAKKKRKRHKQSIMHKKDGTCYLCMLLNNDYRKHDVLHEHHIFGGKSNRSHSEAEGLKVYLCVEHHMTGKDAVHNAKNSQKVQERLHQIGQQEFEKTHTREEFMNIFGRNYL